MIQAFDDRGNFITGMAEKGKEHKYFKALIDKEKKEICKDFTVIQTSEKDSPGLFNFSIVLDYSGSMEQDYPVMQSAAQQFINTFLLAYKSFGFYIVIAYQNGTDPDRIKIAGYRKGMIPGQQLLVALYFCNSLSALVMACFQAGNQPNQKYNTCYNTGAYQSRSVLLQPVGGAFFLCRRA